MEQKATELGMAKSLYYMFPQNGFAMLTFPTSLTLHSFLKPDDLKKAEALGIT